MPSIRGICRTVAGIVLLHLVAGAALAAAAEPSRKVGGIKPDVGALFIDSGTGQAQMGVTNSEERPLLLKTDIIDVPEDPSAPAVLVLPPVTRVEGGKKNIVRFLLMTDGKEITSQHYKRVTLEGIPPKDVGDAGRARVSLNIRYDLPVIISPPNLPKNDAPWESLEFKQSGRDVVVTNPSRYVVRLTSQVEALPSGKRFEALGRTFILPGDRITFRLPEAVDEKEISAIRLFPASAYGAAVDPFDAVLRR